MMKKLLLAFFIAFSLLVPVSTASAADNKYEKAMEAVAKERTDDYALDYYKSGAYSRDPAIVAQANEIVAGITDDYEKVRAIYEWASNNITYTTEIPAGRTGIERFKYGHCAIFASTTMYLAQAAGFPAKVVEGIIPTGRHAWTEVYVDGRWVFIDSTNDFFDEPVSWWAYNYTNFESSLRIQDDEAWDGSLYFVDSTNDKVLKEVKNFPFNGLVTSTYGFDIDTLYVDRDFETPFTLNTVKVTFPTSIIYVQMDEAVVITFDSNGGTAVNPVISKGYGEKIKKPANPTKAGYKFVGWYVEDGADAVDFSTWTFDYDLTLYAKWKKDTTTKTYKVTFNTKNGSTVKPVTVTANSTISKPKNPTRKGYKFVNWYKDSKCTKVWNFKTDKVKSTTILYAKWKKN